MRASFILGVLSASILAATSGCSSDEGDDEGGAGTAAVAGNGATGGSSGASASGGAGGSGTGGGAGKGGAAGNGGGAGTAGTGGSAGEGGTGGDAGAPSATGGTSGDAGATGAEAGASAEGGAAGSGTELVGVCAHRSEGTVTADEFTSFEEYYLIGEEGFGDDICVVRFDVTRVGPAPEGCTDCLWTHTVELGMASVEVDQNGVCASSELGMDADAIAELEGSQVSYGFVPEADGHASIVVTYNESTSTWESFTNGTWDDSNGFFRFDRRNGFCSY